MTDSTFLFFLASSLALIVTPGPDTMYVLTRGMKRGSRAGVRAASGVSTGILVHTLGAVVGLSVLLRTSAVAYSAVKYVGAAYLVYLGVQALRSDGAVSIDDDSSGDSFRQGVAVNVLNPKVALFFLAFLPQFAGSSSTADVRMATLGLIYAVLTLAYLSLVALTAHRVSEVVRDDPRVNRGLQWLSGTVFVGFGLKLAIPERVI